MTDETWPPKDPSEVPAPNDLKPGYRRTTVTLTLQVDVEGDNEVSPHINEAVAKLAADPFFRDGMWGNGTTRFIATGTQFDSQLVRVTHAFTNAYREK